MNENYQRTPQDIAHEYDAVWATVRARQSRCPATAEGLDYSQRMEDIGDSVEVCVSEPGVLVTSAEELAIAEQALKDARARLTATVDEFLALDTARQQTAAKPRPQIATVAAASREPTAHAAS